MRGVLGFFFTADDGCLTKVHVARACAIHGVHYVDLSPEPHFVADVATKCVFVT